jgi:hypothetical protein
MGDTINLDQDHLEIVRAAAKDSIATCTKTSAPDVYVSAVSPKDTTKLHQGDSTAFPKVSRLRFHLFRTNVGGGPFSATVEITTIPAAAAPAAPTALMAKVKPKRAPTGAKPKSNKPKRKTVKAGPMRKAAAKTGSKRKSPRKKK